MTTTAPPRIASLWPAVVGLAVAALVAALIAPTRPAARSANLPLSTSALPGLYLMLHKTEAGMGTLVDRRGSTMRRDDAGADGHKRRVDRVALGPGIRDAWLVRSNAGGTIALLPAEAIADWSYPFVHAFVAARAKGWPLAQLSWRQLYVDRAYRGLYLRARLPHDLRKKDGGTGALRLLLGVDQRRATRISTRFDDGSGALIGQIALGRFPETVSPPAEVAALGRLAGGGETAFVLAAEGPFEARLSPLPFSLSAFFAAAMGRVPAQIEDARFGHWRDAALAHPAGAAAGSHGFDDAAVQALRAAWQRYAPALVAAAVLDAKARDLEPPDAAALRARMAAADALGLLADAGAEGAP